jgi:hypothetical protein
MRRIAAQRFFERRALPASTSTFLCHRQALQQRRVAMAAASSKQLLSVAPM